MFLSVFELFKIGIGPSSSHTVGPMVAASRFLALLERRGCAHVARLSVSLHGSLAFTGMGHATDRAVILGLAGERPDGVDPDGVDAILAEVSARRTVSPPGLPALSFDPATDIVFDYGPPLQGHANGLRFFAHGVGGNVVLEETYYSIGGGFVKTQAELNRVGDDESPLTRDLDVPYPFASSAQMLAMGRECGLSIAEMKRANELTRCADCDLDPKLDIIWQSMNGCMGRGLTRQGQLPGGLKVRRRAAAIYEKLKAEAGRNRTFEHTVMDWLSVYAMAVNEENAAGGRVVTAPTNGAAGVIPAVIRYYLDHCPDADAAGIRTFLLAAAAIGGIIKHNASISGAEVGCQGEVGSASAMAAAGLAAALGGTNEQVENAAEIALEHHLGMTCDPVGGLVQVPCIERNALGAVKAVTAASLALRGDGSHFVPLDTCIETMRQTGLDMSEKYKETSKGGLAVNVVEC
ncbi:L-serine ammonia-lyase [Microbaculum marinum]|uniref:L-serine dehydratase n=1 Tax=Microbaculum marinum TaxID=1764581 RepID=A0AAW9S1E6_9HYPH